MSIASTTNRNDYVGNGAVDTYSYTFRIFDEDDLTVIVRNLEDVETVLTKTTHYTVTGVGANGGGNVVLVNGAFDWIDAEGDLKTDYILVIRRVLDLIQATDIRNQGSFFPEVHEDFFDRTVMVEQQQQDDIDRSLRLPPSINPADFSTILPADIASTPGASIIVNGAGDGLAVGPTVASIADHEADTTNIHGIVDTSLLVTLAGSQTLTNKTYSSAIISIDQQSYNSGDVATTSTITALATEKPFIRFTGSTATQVQGIDAAGLNKAITLHNASSADVTFKHQNIGAAAGNRIITALGTDLILKPNSSTEFIYDATQTRWVIKSGSGAGGSSTIFGSAGTPRTIAATGISSSGSHMSTTDFDQIVFVNTSGGEVDVTTNPQITAGTSVGQKMLVVGTSNDNFILLENGNGLSLNGDWRSFDKSAIGLFWNGSEWSEIFRRV